MKNNFILRVKALRVKRGISQGYMAAKMGVSQNAYSKLERGKIRLTEPKIIKLASVLNEHISYIERIEPYDISKHALKSNSLIQKERSI
jgi:transcriptional regulator with XRE-family HTH domain